MLNTLINEDFWHIKEKWLRYPACVVIYLLYYTATVPVMKYCFPALLKDDSAPLAECFCVTIQRENK